MKIRLYDRMFEHNITKILRRLVMLILIAILAFFIALLIGLTIISAGLNRRYQANKTAKKRVLPFQYLGRRAIKDTRLISLKQHLSDAIT